MDSALLTSELPPAALQELVLWLVGTVLALCSVGVVTYGCLVWQLCDRVRSVRLRRRAVARAALVSSRHARPAAS